MSPSPLPTRSLKAALSVTALAAAAGIGLLQQQRLRTLEAGTDPLAVVAQQRQQLQLLAQVPSFGFDNVLADWTMLQFIQYFGDAEARRQTGYGLSPDYFEVILERDPYFRDAYLFLSISSTLFAGQPARTVKIFEQYLPQLTPTTPERAYVIWRYKGSDELLFLGDPQAAAQSFETAADWASVYDDAESQAIAAASRQTAAFLRENPSSSAAQISAWGIVLSNALDRTTQQFAIRRIEQLGGRVEVDAAGRFRVIGPAS